LGNFDTLKPKVGGEHFFEDGPTFARLRFLNECV